MDRPIHDPDELPYDELGGIEVEDDSDDESSLYTDSDHDEGVNEPVEQQPIGEVVPDHISTASTGDDDQSISLPGSGTSSREQLLEERRRLYNSRHECEQQPCASTSHGMGILMNEFIHITDFVGNKMLRKLLDLVCKTVYSLV